MAERAKDVAGARVHDEPIHFPDSMDLNVPVQQGSISSPVDLRLPGRLVTLVLTKKTINRRTRCDVAREVGVVLILVAPRISSNDAIERRTENVPRSLRSNERHRLQKEACLTVTDGAAHVSQPSFDEKACACLGRSGCKNSFANLVCCHGKAGLGVPRVKGAVSRVVDHVGAAETWRNMNDQAGPATRERNADDP